MNGFSDYWNTLAFDPYGEPPKWVFEAGRRCGKSFYQNLWSTMYAALYTDDPGKDEPEAAPADHYARHKDHPDCDYDPWEPSFMEKAQSTYSAWLIEARKNYDKLKRGEQPDTEAECTLRERVEHFEDLINTWDDDAYDRFDELRPDAEGTDRVGDGWVTVKSTDSETGTVRMVRSDGGPYIFGSNGLHSLGSFFKQRYGAFIEPVPSEEPAKGFTPPDGPAMPVPECFKNARGTILVSKQTYDDLMAEEAAARAKPQLTRAQVCAMAERLLSHEHVDWKAEGYEAQDYIDAAMRFRSEEEAELRLRDLKRDSAPSEDNDNPDFEPKSGRKYNFPVVCGIEHGQTWTPENPRFAALPHDEHPSMLQTMQANAAAQERAMEYLDRKRDTGPLRTTAKQLEADLLGTPEGESKQIRCYSAQAPTVFEQPWRSFMITGIQSSAPEPEPEPEDEAAIREYNRKIMLGGG